jgi:phage gpG-like protein
MDFDAGQWEGLEGLGDEELARLMERGPDAVEAAAMHFAEAVRQTLGPESGPRTGRTYKVSKRGRLHQASAPGEPPAVLNGFLRRSIAHETARWNGNAIESPVGTAMEYGRILEFGGVTPNGARILPRPYWEPTAQREAGAIQGILETELFR